VCGNQPNSDRSNEPDECSAVSEHCLTVAMPFVTRKDYWDNLSRNTRAREYRKLTTKPENGRHEDISILSCITKRHSPSRNVSGLLRKRKQLDTRKHQRHTLRPFSTDKNQPTLSRVATPQVAELKAVAFHSSFQKFRTSKMAIWGAIPPMKQPKLRR
jgi:hypothetical protein